MLPLMHMDNFDLQGFLFINYDTYEWTNGLAQEQLEFEIESMNDEENSDKTIDGILQRDDGTWELTGEKEPLFNPCIDLYWLWRVEREKMRKRDKRGIDSMTNEEIERELMKKFPGRFKARHTCNMFAEGAKR